MITNVTCWGRPDRQVPCLSSLVLPTRLFVLSYALTRLSFVSSCIPFLHPIHKVEQLTQWHQITHPSWVFCFLAPPPVLRVLCCHFGQPSTEMGGCRPSPTPPCPLNRTLGLLRFTLAPPFVGSCMLVRPGHGLAVHITFF